jgi:AraC-like DNA-binding protein
MDDHVDQAAAENGTWRRVGGIWRRVHGSFLAKGVSIEWHDFRLDGQLDVSPSFHPNSLEICLNFTGQADIGIKKIAECLEPSQIAIYTTLEDGVPASRRALGTHRFLTIEFTAEYLARQFEGCLDRLRPEVRDFIENKKNEPKLLEKCDLLPHLLTFREHVLHPPVPESAKQLWCEGKIAELLASLLFSQTARAELFCESQRRKNRELVEQMLHILERDMANPPSLEILASMFHKNPFHLSRILSETTGLTIPAIVRKFRLVKAAALLRDSRKPITEIAFEVGYSSIGAFNKAFRDQYQSTPSHYRKGQSLR